MPVYAVDLDLRDEDVLYPVGIQLVPTAGSWPSHANPIDIKDDFLRALLAAASTTAAQHPIMFAPLAAIKDKIVTANLSLKSKGRPFTVHLAFKDPEVASLLAMVLDHVSVLPVPSRAVSSAAEAAAAPQHPTQIAVRAIVPLGSPISMLIAQKHNVLHIFPVQCFGPKVMTMALARIGQRDGWLTELVSLDYGQSVSSSVIDHFAYPRGFFRAVISCNADSRPVPTAFEIDTSRFRFTGAKVPLPPRVSFNIRAQFGAKPPQVAGQRVAGQQADHVATSALQHMTVAASSAKRSRMEGDDDVSTSNALI